MKCVSPNIEARQEAGVRRVPKAGSVEGVPSCTAASDDAEAQVPPRPQGAFFIIRYLPLSFPILASLLVILASAWVT